MIEGCECLPLLVCAMRHAPAVFLARSLLHLPTTGGPQIMWLRFRLSVLCFLPTLFGAGSKTTPWVPEAQERGDWSEATRPFSPFGFPPGLLRSRPRGKPITLKPYVFRGVSRGFWFEHRWALARSLGLVGCSQAGSGRFGSKRCPSSTNIAFVGGGGDPGGLISSSMALCQAPC